MASIGREGKDRRRLMYRDANGRQRCLRLGRCSQKAAQAALAGFEWVLQSNRLNSALHPDGVRWLEGLDARLYKRVVRLGLAEPRQGDAEAVTLGAVLKAYFAAADVKPSTAVRYGQTHSKLIDHFGETRDPDTITERDAEAWRKKLREADYSVATVSKDVQIARQVFRWAVRRGMAKANPFAEVRAGSQVNADRHAFIDRQTIAKVIDAAPDGYWRLLIALSRFGGLRVPSEAVGLKWTDVDWSHSRLTIRSTKTGERCIPMFPELCEPLMEAFNAAPDGSEYVFPDRFHGGYNPHTHFLRIIRRAGLKPWPRVWHNLRASRQTELAATFPLHVACAWIGNSKAVASAHYLQLTDSDWERAVAPSEKAATKAATHTRPQSTKGEQRKQKTPENTGVLGACGNGCDCVSPNQVGATGLEPVTPAV